MRRLPPLNSLKAFEAVARLGSVVKAAEELCVSHGAVSKQLLNLERWLEAPLFDRSSRRIEVTEAGERFRQDVKDVFDRLEEAVGRVLPGGAERKLIVSAPPTLTLHWLVPRLTSFVRQHPDIRIQLNNRRDRENRLPAGVDVAIRRGKTNTPHLAEIAFMNEALTPVCAPGLLAGRRLAAVHDLAGHPWLMADMRPEDWQHWLMFAGVPDLQPSATLGFDHTYLALEAALDGLGVAIAPLYLIQDELESGRLQVMFPELRVPSDGYYFVHEDKRGEDEAIRALRLWLQSEGQAHEAVVTASVAVPRKRSRK